MKRIQKWISVFLTVVMLFQTFGNLVLAQSQATSETVRQVQTETDSDAAKAEVVLPERAKNWSGDYDIAVSQEQADTLRNQKEDVNLLITAKECVLSGLKYGEIVTTTCQSLDLSDVKGKLLSVAGSAEIQLKGTELEQLYLNAGEDETINLHVNSDTKIPEIILEGSGNVVIEGNASLGMVRVQQATEQLTVRATCSVLNESGQSLKLKNPDGNTEELNAGVQRELVLSSYLITFMADGEVYESHSVKPGEIIAFPETDPEKEGSIFTTWYKDDQFEEACSQFDMAEGEATFYARFVEEADAIEITFDTMGGRELEPQVMAKGESLLTRSVSEIYTEKEGYTFGGWCKDKECTEAVSYSDPLEESQTLYAYFVSNEAQQVEKDGTAANLKDFGWQDKIPLRTDTDMTPEEVMEHVRVDMGSGELKPELQLEEAEDGYYLYGSYYEKNGETGLEPGSTFSITLTGDVHFADYPDETDTAIVSVQKERVENVVFSEDITYVLWEDVLEYLPVTELEDTDQPVQEEVGLEEEADSESEEETEDDEDDEFRTKAVQDAEGEDAEEYESAPYTPGKILVENGGSYQEGDIVAFYDGEIGRDEKNIDAYTEGSMEGYVLFAEIISEEETEDGTILTFGYANPEDYLADFDVHVTDDVNMENELSADDLDVLASRLSRQIEDNEELKAQMLVTVMSAPETQSMLDDMYGEGVYSLAAMTATLSPERPEISLSVSGSEVSATISISATAAIMNNGKVMLQVQPRLAFTQALGVQTNVNGGKVWIDMSLTLRSTTKIELTVTATTGEEFSVFDEAKEALAEVVKPEGIAADGYEEFDSSVSDLMDTMNSIVSTSLSYNDIFDILLLNLRYSFYGIITVGFEVHLVGQIGVLATFGVEIVAKSGVRIGFKYNFLKFKGSSYSEKLESSVTNNIYLIGKVGVRVGLRLILSITMCGIATASISGSLYAYAELTGLFFNTTNLLTGANTNLGALHFEVGIDVVVTLGLRVNLIVKKIQKNWTVYTGRWPLWSTSVSSSLSYVDEDKLKEMWEPQEAKANIRNYFGFEYIPMKTWDLMGGDCTENQVLSLNNKNVKLEVKNLVVNDKPVAEGDPEYALFKPGDTSKAQNPAFIYMDEAVAGEYQCETAELDLVLTYENNSSSALVKKQEVSFHLKKKCSIATTTHNVKVVLYDWCSREWGLENASWDNALVYETSFSSSHLLGRIYEPTATGTLNLGEVISTAQSIYPELREYKYQWQNPSENALTIYSAPRVSNFCYMTPQNGVVRYDVYSGTNSYDVTYYLYVQRFEGNDDNIRYHVRVNDKYEEDTYEFKVKPTSFDKELTFEEQEDGTYLLEARRAQFNGTDRPLMMSVNGEEASQTGFSLNGREYQQDVFFDLTLGNSMLGIQPGNGVSSYAFLTPEDPSEGGVKAGTRVQLQVELEEGYGGLEVLCDNNNVEFQVDGNVVSFIMPGKDLSFTLCAYKLYSVTYLYNYGGYETYDTVYLTEKETVEKISDPQIDGLTFRGWYTSPDASGEPYEFGQKPETDIILYADWTCNVTVYFSPAKGKAAYLTGEDEQMEEHLIFEGDTTEYYSFTYSTLRVGDTLLNIQIPEYEGYQFADWYTDPQWNSEPLIPENYVVTGGMEMYARWVQMFTVTFDANDGSENSVLEEVTALSGFPIPMLPDEPERECYTFTGWYRNHAATESFDTETELITGNLTLYAGWTPKQYEIVYDLDGGINAESNPVSYTTEESFSLAQPTKEGYTFEGWTGTGLEETSKDVTVGVGNSGDRTYQAVWKPIDYTISYSRTYESTESYPTSYNIESEAITLPTPVREGYTFDGWTGTDLDLPQVDVVIPTGSMGNRSYTANWSTSDPIKSILEKVGLLADKSPYEAELTAFLPDETDINGTIDYASVEAALEETVVTYLNDLVAADAELDVYSGNIQITAEIADRDLTGDDAKQKYNVTLTVTFTDDDSNQTTETFTDYQASLKKLAVQCTWPTASKIALNQKVKDSQLSADGAASAAYREQSVAVAGSFDWLETEKDKVPFGRNNGTTEYAAVFTPELTDRYTPAQSTIPVLTQILLYASASADSRAFIWMEEEGKGSTEATGTLSLVYADAAGNATTEVFQEAEGLLTGGSFSFADGNPEKDKVVTCTGYTMDSGKNSSSTYGENAYVLANPDGTTAQADIWQADKQNSNISVSRPSTSTKPYGTQLGDIALNGGSVTYNSVPLEGTWSWAEAAHTVPNVGSSHTAIFTPDAKYQGGFVNFAASVYVSLSYKKVLVPSVGSAVYNGTYQESPIQDGDDYVVLSSEGGVSAGNYLVTLSLKDKTNYTWYVVHSNGGETGLGSADRTLNFVIQKASPVVATEGQVANISYGQKLTAGDTVKVDGLETELSAKSMLSGYSITYPDLGEQMLGTWSWVTETDENGKELLTEKRGVEENKVSQPLSAGTHKIKARYTPNSNTENLNVLDIYLDVVVQKTTPLKADDYSLVATCIYSPNKDKELSNSVITGNGKIYNPYTGEEVAGSWKWADETIVPTGYAVYSTMFVPTDTANYTENLSGQCSVNINDGCYIVGSVKGRQLIDGTEKSWLHQIEQEWTYDEYLTDKFGFAISTWQGDWTDLILEEFKMTWKSATDDTTQSITITPTDGGGSDTYWQSNMTLKINRSEKKIYCEFVMPCVPADNIYLEVKVSSSALTEQTSLVLSSPADTENAAETANTPETQNVPGAEGTAETENVPETSVTETEDVTAAAEPETDSNSGEGSVTEQPSQTEADASETGTDVSAAKEQTGTSETVEQDSTMTKEGQSTEEDAAAQQSDIPEEKSQICALQADEPADVPVTETQSSAPQIEAAPAEADEAA